MNKKQIKNQEIEIKETEQIKNSAPEIETKIVDEQQGFSSRAAQKEHIKNLKLKLKQEALNERERIELERVRLRQAILDIQAEIEKAKVKQTQVFQDAKFQEAKMIEEAIKNKKIEQEELRKRNELLKSRQKDISLINEQHTKRQQLFKQEAATRQAEANQRIKLGKLAIKEELEAKKREIEAKKFEQAQLANELKNKLKEERLEAYKLKEEEKRKFRQEVEQMKLELFAEKNRQKQEYIVKKQEANRLKLEELEKVRQETEALKDERAAAIEAAKLSRIKANLELEKRKNQLAQEIKEHAIEVELSKEEQEAEVEAIKEINNIEVAAVVDANDVLIQKTTMIPVSSNISEYELEKQREEAALRVFHEDYVTLVSEFRNFDKNGEKELERIKKQPSPSKVRKLTAHAYYGPMIENYVKIQEEGNFVDLEKIIIGGHIISEDEIHESVIKNKVRTLQKAVLQGIPIKVGNYYVMPVEKAGIHSFYISTHLKDGEVVFDNNKIFSSKTIKGIEEIVDYKFENGASIKLLEGLSISALDGNLAIAIYPNIIK